MKINRTLTRRGFSALTVSVLVYASRALSMPAAAEVVLEPTPDDGLGGRILEAISRGVTRFRLRDGAYGPQTLKGISGQTIEIIGSAGTVMDMLMLVSCSNVAFSNIAFRGEKTSRGSGNGLVYIAPSSSHISFQGCSFATVSDTTAWSATDWVQKPYVAGLLARGPYTEIARCRFFNLRNCVLLLGDNSNIRDCSFTDFGNDGIEFGANNVMLLNNTISGSRHTPTETMHSDGIQGFPAPNHGVYNNIEIRGNRIQFSGPGDYMQGISIFDGHWRNIRVFDNVVHVNMWNAIALYGIDTVNVEGNVVSSTDVKVRNWIEVRAGKDGTPSTGIVVQNNTAPDFRIAAGAIVTANRVKN